jgi:hypothetical protein
MVSLADGDGRRERPVARPYGSLDTVVDSERRTLRPIGAGVAEVAWRTDDLLAGLSRLPAVHVFRGTRPAGTDLPPTPHAIVAGRSLVLVEGVAWPSGRYRTDAQGRVFCDDVRTGQSTEGVRAAIRCWREALTPCHRVGAVVVVHRGAGDQWVLPASDDDLTWAFPETAVAAVRRRLGRSGRVPGRGGEREVSPTTWAALHDALARAVSMTS